MKRLGLLLTGVMAVSFAVLGCIGTRIYQEMPPIPDRVVTTKKLSENAVLDTGNPRKQGGCNRSRIVSKGKTVIASGAIAEGQNVWQAMGGMEVGSVWGHGSYVAPDWTAEWLHRECAFLLDR